MTTPTQPQPQPPPAPQPEPAPPPPDPTPDERHETQLKGDPRGRFASMVDLVLRGCSPSELEEACGALRPLAQKAQARL